MPEPITLDEAKAHLRKTTDDEDALITNMIPAARRWVENYTGLALEGDPANVEAPLKQAMLLLIGQWYMTRGASHDPELFAPAFAVISLCRPYRDPVVK